MTNHKGLIASAALPERSVELCLRPDLLARAQEVERQLQRAEAERKAVSASLASGSASRDLAAVVDVVRQEMAEHTLTVRLRALPRRAFAALKLEHPPREGNLADLGEGCNVEAAADALVRRCVVDPSLDADDWAALDERLSDGQWQQLAGAAWAINARDVEVPFSRTASRILQTSDDD